MQIDSSQLNSCVKVYVSAFDSGVVVGEVKPASRNEVIQRCTDTLTKQQRYCVWRLLDFALRANRGGGVDSFTFTLTDSGKWICDNGVQFSLSHCDNVVAVAVCNHAVGVDVQSVASFARQVTNADFAARVLTENEQRLLRGITSDDARAQTLATIWTQKESFFKLHGCYSFVPKAIDTTNCCAHSQLVTLNGERYVLSVASLVGGVNNLSVDVEYVKVRF